MSTSSGAGAGTRSGSITKLTPVTAPSSDAAAVTSTIPCTLAPAAGVASVTLGLTVWLPSAKLTTSLGRWLAVA